MTSDFKFYPCTDKALELLRKYDKGLSTLNEKQGALNREYREKFLANQKEAFVELSDIWRIMAALAGIDPGTVSFSNPDYSIETKYLDQGFGGITYVPRQPNPFMMGDDEDFSESDEITPDKPLLN